MVCEYETINGIVKVICKGCIFGSSIEDFDVCMAKTIDKILEVKKVERIILAERREHEYDYEQTKLLIEIANVYNKLLNEDKIASSSRLGGEKCKKCLPNRSNEIQFLIKKMLRRDPIGAYVKTRRLIRHYQSSARKSKPMCRK